MRWKRKTFAVFGLLMMAVSVQVMAEQNQEPEPMGFFITSVGPGNGADLGGLEGADAHCQSLAEAVGAGDRTWRAYLSTQAAGNQPAVDAKDRIGDGPWANAEGLRIATDVDNLHYDNANIRYEYALNERGERVNSGASGDSPSMHDILTGSRLDGTAFAAGDDRSCGNWTTNTLSSPSATTMPVESTISTNRMVASLWRPVVRVRVPVTNSSIGSTI